MSRGVPVEPGSCGSPEVEPEVLVEVSSTDPAASSSEQPIARASAAKNIEAVVAPMRARIRFGRDTFARLDPWASGCQVAVPLRHGPTTTACPATRVRRLEGRPAEAWCEQLTTLPDFPELPRCGQ